MKTKYKKVSFEIDDQDPDLTTLIGKDANFVFNPNTNNGEELSAFISGCEEISDNSHQIEKLEADKAELLEALEMVHELVTDFTADSLMIIESVSEKAIQKHKK